MLLIPLIKQARVVFLSFEECVLSCSHFKSCVIDGASAIFDLLFYVCFVIKQGHVNNFNI